jgi:2'-5' RNA ligase
VIVPLPEAQVAVGSWRAALDRSAGWGVPPHVTVLYPFVPPDRIDKAVLRKLADAVKPVPAFDVVFARSAWFDDTVLWLPPEPDGPFRTLTAAVWARFPDHPPYGGRIAEPTPHLTVGQDMPVELLRAAADAIGPHLPIRAHVAAARLIQGSPEPHSWHTVAELPLGRASSDERSA